LLNRLSRRLAALFVPSVAVNALLDLQGRDDAADAIKQLFDWERDRLFTLAKGLAASSIAVLTTLIVDTIESKPEGTGWTIWLSSALVALLLGWAGFILTGLRRLAEQYALALRDYG
jgi:hypothetical protein